MKKHARILAVLLVLSLILSFAAVVINAATGETGDDTPTVKSIMEEALIMKTGSDNALSRGEKTILFLDGEGNPVGAPYKTESGVMVPLLPIIEYTKTPYTVSGAGTYNLTVLGDTVTVEAGNSATVGTVIPLSAAPVLKSFNDISVLYVALDDVESIFDGFYVTYDASGLIYVSEYDEFVNRSDDDTLMREVAEEFIYTDIDFRNIVGTDGSVIINYLGADELPFGNVATVNSAYKYDGKGTVPVSEYKAYTDNIVNNFKDTDEIKKLSEMLNGTGEKSKLQHPYIKTTQSRFDMLNSVYLATENYDSELKWYIEEQIAYADKYLKAWANLDENGSYVSLKEGQWRYNGEGIAVEGLTDATHTYGWNTNASEGDKHSVSQMPYTEKYTSPSDVGYGYDPAGGRLNVLSNGEACLAIPLEPVALAYQITRSEKYLRFAYDWMVALCSWEHWGPGHFLNCANTARPLATAYDWLYNDFVTVYGQGAVDALAARIYENAVYEAQISLAGLLPEHRRTSDSSRYHQHIGNWNSVCTLGMLTASLAIMNECGGAYKDEALYVIAASLGHYMERGFSYLSLDGGYIESAGYWGSVNNIHFISKILMDTAGTDFGFLDVPGVDVTDYFGCQMEGSDYTRWNYHDDGLGTQPSWWYYLSADLYDNPEYTAIRYQQIHSGNKNKAPHRYDLLYYDKEKVDAAKDYDVNLTLDYSMTSIDATVVRDSWEKNSLFAGIMGGFNDVAHGQYDSGNWIYENNGVRWFGDLGSDNYNLSGGGRGMGYYKYSAEGNNTLALTSDWETLPHGQMLKAGGEIVSFKNNEYGSATVIDQNSVYAGLTEYARRGMLVTNNRNTFVIQDEVKSINPETFYWFGHYDTKKILEIEIAEDGRVAYMVAPNADGEFQTLRVTLLSDNKNLKFEIMDTHTMVLKTPDWNYSPSKNGICENARDQYMKLAVKAEGVTELNMAVVIEVVKGKEDTATGYGKWVPMSEWQAEVGDGTAAEDKPVYTVYYKDGTTEEFFTSRIIDGICYTGTDGNLYVSTDVERVECHGSVSVTKSVRVSKDHTLTVNLNGNLLYQTGTIVVGGYLAASDTGGLYVNNGTWYSQGAYFHLRHDSTLSLNKIKYSTTASMAIRDEGAKMLFTDSELTFGNKLMNVTNNVHTTSESDHTLVFSNTKVNIGTYLIDFYEGYYNYNNYLDVYLLDGSSLSLNGYTSVNGETGETVYNTESLIHYTLPSNDVEIKFFVEDGVKLDFPRFVLPESENVEEDTETEAIEKMYRSYSLSFRKDMSLGEDGTVNPGTALELLGSDFAYTNPFAAKITESGDEAYPYVVVNTALGELIKLEASFEDGSVMYYTTNELSDLLLTSGYSDNGMRKILLLADASLKKIVNLGDSQTLVLDINGYTLSLSGRITMGDSSGASSCYVTVIGDGGKIVKTSLGDGFCARLGTTLIFNDVEIESKNHVLWDNGAENIVFNGCKVTGDGNFIYLRYGALVNNDGAYSHAVVLNDTSVTVKGSLFHYQEMTAAYTMLDAYVMGTSKLSYNNLYGYAENANVTVSEHNVHVERGALLPRENIVPEYTDARYGELYAYEDLTLSEDYTVVKTAKYPLFRVVARDGFYTVEYVSTVKGVKSSLTLYSDFTVNFYIPVEGNVIDLVMINGETVYIHDKSETYTENGVTYYKVSVRNIAPNYAADDIKIVFSSEGFEEHKTFSVIKYCDSLFKNARFASSYPIAASVIGYVDAAYGYTGREKPEILTNILTAGVYRANTPEPMPYSKSTVDFGNIGIALRGAQLDLGASLKFRFNLKSDFTGTLIINGRSYEVVSGVAEGLSYVLVEMRAYDMYDAAKYISISGVRASDGAEFSGTYDLRAYIENTDLSAPGLSKLISTLYTYCTEAYSNKYGIPQERPVKGDTPYVDLGI